MRRKLPLPETPRSRLTSMDKKTADSSNGHTVFLGNRSLARPNVRPLLLVGPLSVPTRGTAIGTCIEPTLKGYAKH